MGRCSVKMMFYKNLAKFTGKELLNEIVANISYSLIHTHTCACQGARKASCNFVKSDPSIGDFPGKLRNFYVIAFLQNTSGELLLDFSIIKSDFFHDYLLWAISGKGLF